jgi:uncharacterized protein YgbK (DUF1537 family)
MIGVIADDLTGAAEIGAIGLRHGLRAEIIRSGRLAAQADLVCVDTDSRSCTPEAAAKLATTAARLLKRAGAKWIYKKVDSVLRGQVTAEVEAVMQDLRLEQALVVPANPALGRTIQNGDYFVRGRPLHKTEFAQDPEYPRRSSQVLRLLKVPEIFQLRLANGDRLITTGTIVVGQAQTSADVLEWAESCDEQTLRVGGSEFFNALLEKEVPGPTNGNTWSPASTAGCELFVSGSATASARKFVTAARRRKTPVFTLPLELMWGAEFKPAAIEAVTERVVSAFEKSPRVILAVGLPPVRNLAIARGLSRNLVQIATRVIGRAPVARVFAEGGATAAELVREMGWPRLTVMRELAPGVATLATGRDDAILLTIKPGSYAWPARWT